MKKSYIIIGCLLLLITGIILVRVQAQAMHGIKLSWTEATGGTPAATFNVYCATTSGAEAAPATATGITSSPYVYSSGTPGTTYYCKVTAVSAIGEESAMSNEASATFPGPPPTPSGLTAVQQ